MFIGKWPMISSIMTSWMMLIAVACVVAAVGLSINPYLLFLLTRVVIFVMLIIVLIATEN